MEEIRNVRLTIVPSLSFSKVEAFEKLFFILCVGHDPSSNIFKSALLLLSANTRNGINGIVAF